MGVFIINNYPPSTSDRILSVVYKPNWLTGVVCDGFIQPSPGSFRSSEIKRLRRGQALVNDGKGTA